MMNTITCPDNYIYKIFDVTNIEECKEIAEFLKYNYVEDNRNKYRFNYTTEFIHWYLNCLKSKALGITHNNILVGFISSRYIKVSLNKKIEDLIEVDFLCIKKNERNNKLCRILLNELIKISNEDNVYDAIFTSESNYNNLLSSVKYYSRMINIKHLYEINYINSSNTLNELEEYYSLPKIKGKKELIKITPDNNFLYIDKCFELYNKYIIKFTVHELFTKETFINSFVNNHVITYVLVENNNVLDFISYYYINISVLERPNEYMKDGYLYYYSNISNNLYKMLQLLLYKLKDDKIDSFLALNIMDTDNSILDELKFIKEKNDFKYCLYKSTEFLIPSYKLAKLLF